MRKLYVDLETTGIYSGSIVEISYIFTQDALVLEAETIRVKPLTEMDPDAYEVNGIANFMCDTELSVALRAITEKLELSDRLVSHNTDFDVGWLRRQGDERLNNCLDHMATYEQIVCTMKTNNNIAKRLYDKDKKRTYTAFGELKDIASALIYKGLTEEQMYEEFNRVYPNQESRFHSSAFDVFLVYLYDRVTGYVK